jgi:hypothetical protein
MKLVEASSGAGTGFERFEFQTRGPVLFALPVISKHTPGRNLYCMKKKLPGATNGAP